jgi:hypothetical protein
MRSPYNLDRSNWRRTSRMKSADALAHVPGRVSVSRASRSALPLTIASYASAHRITRDLMFIVAFPTTTREFA